MHLALRGPHGPKNSAVEEQWHQLLLTYCQISSRVGVLCAGVHSGLACRGGSASNPGTQGLSGDGAGPSLVAQGSVGPNLLA